MMARTCIPAMLLAITILLTLTGDVFCQDVCSGNFTRNQCSGNNASVIRWIMNISAEDCCKACHAEPQCQTWTLNVGENKCYIKGPMTGNFGPGTCISGLKPTPPPSPAPYPTPKNAKNILFMPVDDMRPSIGAFNFSLAHTPNLDKLASEGLLFKRAYVQYAYCSPSRNSFLSGRRPDTTRVWEFTDHFREGAGKNWVTLPQYFKRHGYLTLGGGKIFHPSSATENVGLPDNDWPESWSPEYPYFPNQPPNGEHKCLNPAIGNGGPGDGTWCEADVKKEDSILSDQQIRDNCLDHLRIAKNISDASKSKTGEARPFFVACGFHKPHVPWVVPKEFFNFFPEYPEIPLAADVFAPIGMPAVAWHPPADVRGMDETPSFNGTTNYTRSRLYRRAYYAAISYQDYNIGRVLAELDALGLTDTTVVITFGDHGWQLGEHDTWAKMTNFELGTHTPLLIKAPWMTGSIGQMTSVLAEAVDFYPTLAALAGLPPPESEGEQINGTSLLPVFEDPNNTTVKTAAFSQFAKVSELSVNPHFYRNQTEFMGYTIRVDEWRYTCWFQFDQVNIRPYFDKIVGRELYDHRGDTGLWLDFPGENRNLVNETQYASIVSELHSRVLDYCQL